MKNILPMVLILLISACATTPSGDSRLMLVSSEQMNQMGVTTFQQIKTAQKISTDFRQRKYVECVSYAIINALPQQWSNMNWEVVVFEDDSANAFALPGGKIGVHSGLLKVAETQSQLATVIGHEIAHVLWEHGNQRVSLQMLAQTGLQVADVMSQQKIEGSAGRQMLMAGLGLGAQVGVMLPFSRDHEKEADRFGLHFMAAAGFDPTESVQLWQNMDKASAGKRPPEFLSTHPQPENRIEKLNKFMAKALSYQNEAKQRGLNPQCSL
ncbi:M48 family metallopeptidase [Marinicella litoralis]|uniref:Peptidase M48-like protein n=1 Tax=Marinicella litoralis TaxID=644220 RepID=A0A4R6XYG0_9GAMM|nr:M48 family metallopeptidase [Marinicella litoralis]TDR23344.1 peptidase M48-like protein [Marinicella litoralis]